MGFFSRRCSTRIAKKGIPKAAFIILLVRVGAGAGGAVRGAEITLTILASLKVKCVMCECEVFEVCQDIKMSRTQDTKIEHIKNLFFCFQ
jgi:hypothetical protein